ncbi:interleukin-18-like [Stegastes partitus]|uniref:Interleukin-18-like n=1 Tax=Stegastes partitus TaxID=144197 RepID=A0A9Y4MSB4_9TELE|nr:PREDICTED: interleukin-18-like [Stegastes partitus]
MTTTNIPITFMDIDNHSFYFTAEDDGLEEDTFNKSVKFSVHEIQSMDQKILTLNKEENKFLFQCLTDKERCEHKFECKFTIHIYQSNSRESIVGRPVMLYANKGEEKMVACCHGNCEIQAEAMKLPNKVDATADKALFYMKELASTDTVVFESALYRNHFLGFQRDEKNPWQHKLVLIQQVDGTDSRNEFLKLPPHSCCSGGGAKSTG